MYTNGHIYNIAHRQTQQEQKYTNISTHTHAQMGNRTHKYVQTCTFSSRVKDCRECNILTLTNFTHTPTHSHIHTHTHHTHTYPHKHAQTQKETQEEAEHTHMVKRHVAHTYASACPTAGGGRTHTHG